MADNGTSNTADPNAPIGTAPRITSQTPRTRLVDAALKSIPAVRTRIGREMDKEIVVCSVQNFMKSYLPFVASEDTVNSVKAILKQESLITENPLQFTKFPRQTAKTSWGRSSEQKAFAPLEEIAKAIGDYRFPENNPPRNEFKYRDCPSTTLTSDIEGSTHKNDACFTSDSADQKQLSKTGMAVPIEFKLNGLERVKNNTQVVSANVQIMNEDLRRMFTFGISIEGGLATLWYHCRSHSAASQQFSFVEDPSILIQVFISFMFGTPEQLGYDPNVTLEEDRHYTFTIPSLPGDTLNAKSRRFRSVDTIADYRSINITGRMTRILLVEELDTGEKEPPRFVLKDVWLDQDAPTERELQKAIFDDIVDFWQGKSPFSDSPPLKAFKDMHVSLVDSGDYKKYFLEIVADYRGKTSEPIATNSAPTRGLLDARYIAPAKPLASLIRLRVKTTRSSLPRGSHNVVNIESTSNVNAAPVPPPRTYQQKQQYRVVFREFCTAVGDLSTIGEVVDVLHQVLTPLQLLYCAGWVHRDISSGNILAYSSAKTGWQAKLSDLEYAKRFPPSQGYVPAADPKTGTPFFMAHEILTHYQLYSVPKPTVAKDTTGPPESEFEMPDFDIVDHDLPTDNKDTGKPLAIHNFQHDLESIWWLLLWTITCRVNHLPSQIWGGERFHNSGQMSHERSQCFLIDIEEQLNSMLEPSVKVLARSMNFLRFKMREAFETRQTKGHVNAVPSYAAIHARFHAWFNALNRLPDTTWRDVPLGNGVIEVAAPAIMPVENPAAPTESPTNAVPTSEDIDPLTVSGSNPSGSVEAPSPNPRPPVAPTQALAQVQAHAQVLSPARLPKRYFEDRQDSSDSESESDVEPGKIQSNLVSKLFSVSGPSGSKRQKHEDGDAPL